MFFDGHVTQVNSALPIRRYGDGSHLPILEWRKIHITRKDTYMFKKLVTGALLAACSAVASATAFPSQPVSFVVPYSPGGLTDQLARLYAEKLGDLWGKP